MIELTWGAVVLMICLMIFALFWQITHKRKEVTQK